MGSKVINRSNRSQVLGGFGEWLMVVVGSPVGSNLSCECVFDSWRVSTIRQLAIGISATCSPGAIKYPLTRIQQTNPLNSRNIPTTKNRVEN